MFRIKVRALLVCATLLVIGSSAMAMDIAKGAKGFAVAVVDIPQIVQKSPQISALNVDRVNKLNDLEAFVVSARKDVDAQATDDAKKKLEEKYNKELNVKKNAIDADYAKKLAAIDRDITTLIRIKAKKLGYDLTLIKNSVIDGGDDITSEIIKELK